VSKAPSDLRTFLDLLRKRGELREIAAEVDPRLELAEIHRRVIEEGGPALLFRNVRGSKFPVVTNLYGTAERADLAFGTEGKDLIAGAVRLTHELVPPTFSKLWDNRALLFRFGSAGMRRRAFDQNAWRTQKPADLESLPVTTSWPEDGGPFFTLPLVYTEHPETKVHNLGIYRMQRYDKSSTGMHFQIGKGGGFHLSRAKELGRSLPVNVFIGGPPVTTLAAVAPLPENVPELLLAALLLGKKLPLTDAPGSELPLLDGAEFVLCGWVNPAESRPEGPFGDHYGYYSLTHDFPVFRCEKIFHRPDAIFPATVVGKPRQEDFYIGDYLQELLSPLFPLVMPAVKQLWSYGETGYHSLAAAVVAERYKREALVSGFRILGEGQLALTKFLMLVDRPMDLKNFPAVLEYILERADFRTDLYVFSNLSMDTLDYTGPALNEGSKGVLAGIGDAKRKLPGEFSENLPLPFSSAKVFCRGCLVVSGPAFKENPEAAKLLTQVAAVAEWPLIILCDDAQKAAANSASFLWHTFTRFEPAADIHSRSVQLERYHPQLHPPIVIDARMKPTYPGEVLCDERTSALVDKRWKEYFA